MSAAIKQRGRRYADLVNELGDEMGKARGWQTRVAKRLGVSRYVVSNLVRGTRETVSSDTLGLAMDRLGLDPAYFDTLSGSYRQFVNQAKAPEATAADSLPLVALAIGLDALDAQDAARAWHRARGEEKGEAHQIWPTGPVVDLRALRWSGHTHVVFGPKLRLVGGEDLLAVAAGGKGSTP